MYLVSGWAEADVETIHLLPARSTQAFQKDAHMACLAQAKGSEDLPPRKVAKRSVLSYRDKLPMQFLTV